MYIVELQTNGKTLTMGQYNSEWQAERLFKVMSEGLETLNGEPQKKGEYVHDFLA